MHHILPLPPHHPPLTLTHIRALTRLTASTFTPMRCRLTGRDLHLRGFVRCSCGAVGLLVGFCAVRGRVGCWSLFGGGRLGWVSGFLKGAFVDGGGHDVSLMFWALAIMLRFQTQ